MQDHHEPASWKISILLGLLMLVALIAVGVVGELEIGGGACESIDVSSYSNEAGWSLVDNGCQEGYGLFGLPASEAVLVQKNTTSLRPTPALYRSARTKSLVVGESVSLPIGSKAPLFEVVWTPIGARLHRVFEGNPVSLVSKDTFIRVVTRRQYAILAMPATQQWLAFSLSQNSKLGGKVFFWDERPIV